VRHRHRFLILIITAALPLLWIAWVVFVPGVQAAPISQDSPFPPESPYGDAPEQLTIADEVCLACHGQPGTSMTLENGEEWELYVPAEEHLSSVHGSQGYACVQCHTQVGEYPHPEFSAADQREASLKLYYVCQRCHASQYDLAQDSVHTSKLLAGNLEAAVCTDCHTAHAVQRLKDPETRELLPEARVGIPETCGRCHNAIYQKYRESVHGSAVLGQGNPDAPTCMDCHGSHQIEDATTAEFRLRSPEICAGCHTDPTIMNKYGISTDVLDTYVADFHGTTLVLFEPETPDAQFNKPVCYDCHGVHDIVRPDDPNKGLHVRANLLARCQECHPDATASFPGAWLSHYIPSRETYPLIYYIDLFYKVMIPTVLGGMGILIVMDLGRSTLNRYRQRKELKTASDSSHPSESEAQHG
jgi:hypothetical protein